jgi:hypothetical protein
LSILAYKYRINSIIFIIDGEYFNDAIEIELKNALLERAYNIKEILYLNHAYSIKCQKGDYEILLYCIISGIEICIEEEIVKFIKTKFSIEVNISEIESKQGKDRIKREINQILKRNNLKDITELIKISEKRNLEEAFPNICAVFKKIEEDI